MSRLSRARSRLQTLMDAPVVSADSTQTHLRRLK
jgi:hypothetical protein